jgi:selenocysteine lyase/cysteine desulfurase
MKVLRRQFLQAATAAGVAAAVPAKLMARLGTAAAQLSEDPDLVAKDEAFWRLAQEAYPIDRSLLNLNNGGVSPAPQKVLDAYWRNHQFANQAPSYNMWRVLEPQREVVREKLARLFGSSAEEIAICRNTTEALETVTFGLDLQPGDEILSTNQDYPRMVTAWEQAARRNGVIFRQISIPTPPRDLSEITQAFAAAITPRTRLLHFCHVINLTGQVLPVRDLCRLARERGILSLVDGAHSFAQLDFKASDLECDFFGTSLHKWLSAPFGTGMLYVRSELIGQVWPLFAAEEHLVEDIRKFEQIGTHPCPLFLSIGEACHFQELLQTRRKQGRLQYLRNYWAEQVDDLPQVRFHTSFAPEQSSALCCVEIEGIPPGKLASYLLREHGIIVTTVNHPEFRGIRVTPHVYTTLEELDRFASVLQRVIRDGLPAKYQSDQ